ACIENVATTPPPEEMSDQPAALNHGSQTPRVIVITGGSGLLGSHLAKYYHSREFHVRVVDIKPPEHNARRYYSESVVGNLCDLGFCKFVVRGAEIVLHCANIGNRKPVDPFDDHETINYRANHAMTQNLLTSASQAGVKTFLLTSTYTRPYEPPVEDDSFRHNGSSPKLLPTPRGLCDLEKLHSEQLARTYSNRMTILIVRFSSIYGPGPSWNDGDDTHPASIIRKVLAAKHLVRSGFRPKIELSGGTECNRCLIYVDDAVRTVVSLMEGEKTDYPPRSNQAVSNLELVKLAVEVIELDPSSVDMTCDDGTINIGNSDSASAFNSTSRCLKSYEQGLSQLRDWTEAKIQVTLSGKNSEGRRNYLMPLLSRSSADQQVDNVIKFAILLPLSSQPDSNLPLESLKKFACSLREASWRDRNELGGIRYDVSVYLAIDIKDASVVSSSLRTESRVELIFREHGFSRVFIIPCLRQKDLLGHLLNNSVRRAYEDRCDYYAIMNPATELLDEGWLRIIHAKFREIPVDSGGPSGFGCTAFTDITRPGMPTFPIVHRTHLDIFKGEIIPEELDIQDASIYLFQLYRHFGASATVPVRIRNLARTIGKEADASPDWTFDTFEGSKARIQLWAEQNSLNIKPRMSLDIIIPSYRVSLQRLSRVLSLEPSPSCITTFIIVVDNPRSPCVYELQHSNSHRTDVRILVNESNKGASAARNKGLAVSTAEWVAFLDDDVDPSQNYLAVAEKCIRNQPDAAGFIGNTCFPAAHNIFTTAIQLSGVTSFWDIADRIAEDVPWGITANLIVRRNARDKVQFDLRFPKTGGGEDIDFCINKRKASLKRGGTAFWAAPEVVVAHPWWDKGQRSYKRFFSWSRGDGALIKMHPDLAWRDVTPNSAETFSLATILIISGVLLFRWSMVWFGIVLAIANFLAHVLHDLHRHLIRQNAQVDIAKTPFGRVGWIVAIIEGVLIRMVNDMGRLVGILERREWRSVGKRFDWFTGGPMGIVEERGGGIERAVLILGIWLILFNTSLSKRACRKFKSSHPPHQTMPPMQVPTGPASRTRSLSSPSGRNTLGQPNPVTSHGSTSNITCITSALVLAGKPEEFKQWADRVKLDLEIKKNIPAGSYFQPVLDIQRSSTRFPACNWLAEQDSQKFGHITPVYGRWMEKIRQMVTDSPVLYP
ncbi:unnamed protein product, partial [Rhizoctonia solani]